MDPGANGRQVQVGSEIVVWGRTTAKRRPCYQLVTGYRAPAYVSHFRCPATIERRLFTAIMSLFERQQQHLECFKTKLYIWPCEDRLKRLRRMEGERQTALR